MDKLEQMKTFEDACTILGLDAEKVIPDFAYYPERDQQAMVSHAKLVIIIRAANKLANDGEEWTPDWNNGKWDKYHNWFDMRGGSSGFRFNDCDFWNSYSTVSSRLCFISSEVGKYVAKQFFELWNSYFII